MNQKKETQRTGKEGELRVIGELLKRGFDVYLPLIDIHGIDCIIRTDIWHKDIQIKTRENFATQLLFDVKTFIVRDNFFIICYNIKEPDIFWIIPSKVFKENSYDLKKYNKLRLVLGNEDSKMRQKLHIYRNNFFQLKEGTKEAVQELKQSAKGSGWSYLKKMYPTLKSVEQKIKESKKKGYSQGYLKVLENLKRYREKHKGA